MRALYLICWLVMGSTACYGMPALKDSTGQTNLTRYLTAKKWDILFPHRYNLNDTQKARVKDFYSFDAFVEAAKHFPTFLATGTEQIQKRELAAFLANIAQETSGGWAKAPGGYYKWGLYFLQEQGCEHGCPAYSDFKHRLYPAVPGRSYHGRGPKQLSWNYNYAQFSLAYFGNADILLQHPEMLDDDAVLCFASAIWFWMATQPPKPSCHDIMTGNWKPTPADIKNNRLPGFGATVNVINGGIECGKPPADRTKYRYAYYTYFCNYFKVAPGSGTECTSQLPFGR